MKPLKTFELFCLCYVLDINEQYGKTLDKDYFYNEKNQVAMKNTKTGEIGYIADIHKSLQALEIMLEKEVNIQNFKSALSVGWSYELFEKHCLDNFEYEDDAPYVHSMTREQFELVKEVLL